MQLTFGKYGQVHFSNKNEYYYTLGLLASAKRTSIHWEHNEEQGAWASEGRIHCYSDQHLFTPVFNITTGTGPAIGRINCNEYVRRLLDVEHFREGRINQNIASISSTVTQQYLSDFQRGLAV